MISLDDRSHFLSIRGIFSSMELDTNVEIENDVHTL